MPGFAKAYFEILFENVPEAIVIVDTECMILQINHEFTRLFGYTPEDVVGKDLDPLVAPPSFLEEAVGISRKVGGGETFALETLRKRKSGELFHVSVIGAPILVKGRQVASFSIYRDISDRRQAEEAFLMEKAYLDQLFESAQEAIVLGTSDGRIIRTNSEFCRMFGFGEAEVVGQNIDELISSPELQAEARSITHTVGAGQRFALETRRRRKDGSLIHVSLIGSPIVISGVQVATFGIYRDISDRKRAEENFLLEKAYLEQLVETAAEGIVVLDQYGRITRTNGEFLQMFGYREDEAVGQSIDDLIIPPEVREEALKLTGTATGGSRFALETVRRRKDGSPIHVSIIGSPITINGIQVATYGIYRDITDRRKAEEAFQMEKAYLDQLFESAQEAIVLGANDGRIIRTNSEFCRMFGFEEAEVAGQNIDELISSPELQAEARSITHTVGAGQRFALETRRRRKNGTLIHVSLIGSPIVISGVQVATFGIYRDINDRKKAESELLESRKLLLQANDSLQERTRQLEEVNAMLERLSNLDGLTTIPNRRYFEHFYDLEWRRGRREKKQIAVIMIDVDFFKNYNDHHGHLSGDECLKKIANTLQVLNRAGDLIARYGGEEFVVVLPGTDQGGALHIGEILRQRVKDLKIPHGFSQISPYVTISLGIATQVPDQHTDQVSLLMKADLALYQAKIKGRDRVEFHLE